MKLLGNGTKSKTKRELKAAREKKLIIYKGTHKKVSVDFLAETLQARRK